MRGRFEDEILIGTRADQPLASEVSAGTLYSVTDESNIVERSDSVTWTTYASGGGAGGGDVSGPGSSTDNAIARWNLATGTLIQNSVVTIGDTGIVAFPDDIRQTFNPGATTPGLNVGSLAGDPSGPSDGDLWYNSSTPALNARINGATVALGAGGGGGDVTASGTLTSGSVIVGGGTTVVAATTTGTGVVTALGVNVGSAGAVVVNGGALGTPASGTLTNTTGFPTANLAGLGAGVATFLATPSSANLATAVTDETGSGALVFGTSPVITTDITIPNTGLHLLDTNASHDLIIAPGSDLAADRTLSIVTGDSNRSFTLTADSSIGGTAYVAGGTDVAVADGGTNLSSYTIGDILYASGATTLAKLPIGTAGQVLEVNAGATAPEWGTAAGGGDVTGPGSSTDRAIATWDGTGGDTLFDTAVIIDASANVTGMASLTLTNTGLHLLDTNASHDLIVAPGSDLSADRTLSIVTGDSNRSLTFAGDATISGTNTGDVTLAGTPDYITISGQVITRAQIDLTTDVTGDLPFANLAQGSALSVLGVTGNSTADNASIAAASDHQVFRRSGTAVAFGAVNLAESAAVTGVLPSANLPTAVTTKAIGLTIDGGGSAITTGIKADMYIPFACTITAVTMLADQSGSIVVDIWADDLASYPPTDADSITSATPPTISTATNSQDTTLSSWITAISAGDTLRFNVDSVTSITRVNLTLTVTT